MRVIEKILSFEKHDKDGEVYWKTKAIVGGDEVRWCGRCYRVLNYKWIDK